jgi:hypothetical protein
MNTRCPRLFATIERGTPFRQAASLPRRRKAISIRPQRDLTLDPGARAASAGRRAAAARAASR